VSSGLELLHGQTRQPCVNMQMCTQEGRSWIM